MKIFNKLSSLLFALFAITILASSASAVIFYNEDFEEGSAPGWTKSGNANVVATNIVGGDYAFNTSTSSGYSYSDNFVINPSNADIFNVSFRINFRGGTAGVWVGLSPDSSFSLADGPWCDFGRDGHIQCQYGVSTVSGGEIIENQTYNVTYTVDIVNGEYSLYMDGVLQTLEGETIFPITGSYNQLNAFGAINDNVANLALIDDIYVSNFTDFNMSMSGFICKSCNPPLGDDEAPYETDDTTPTFNFQTSIDSECRIADINTSYASMNSSRDCQSGEGTTNHTCTLTAQDSLVNYNTSIFAACLSAVGELVVELPMLISSLETPNSSEAIQQGIENSIIWPGATIYTDQKVYLRSLNNTRVVATVDKVAVYGNQRWLFNYANGTENLTGIFNMTPVVYVLDMRNISLKDVRTNVAALINNTKR
ncbi:MAG TPA: hypothetical protein VEC16_04145 [Alphaproteobacteria bacterium]|nr:hypothetical protein [Alphaproteobacteria bacterium]